MTVVLVSGDLMAISRVEGAAKQLGASVHAFSSAAQAILDCSAEHAKLLIIDLSLPSLDVKTLVEELGQVTAPRPRIIAFGPHVHEERLAAARDAGCDEVLSRGQFFAQVDSILSR